MMFVFEKEPSAPDTDSRAWLHICHLETNSVQEAAGVFSF